jgi:NADH-quinone oxidoreductase subunit L
LFTAIFSALVALGERNLKKVLAFSSSSQLGLILAVVGMGAHAVAILCVCLHACLKALLFLGTSVLSARSGHNLDVWSLPQRSGRLLVPFWAFVIGVAGLAGLPPSAAFWSTGAAMASIYMAEMPHLWIIGCGALLLTALYGFRVVLLIYARPAAIVQDERPKPLPAAATAALVVLSGVVLGSGLLPVIAEPQLLYRMIVPAASQSLPLATDFPHTIFWLVPAGVALAGLGIAWGLFGFKTAPAAEEQFWQRWTANHFYVEWVCRQALLRPLRWASGFLRDAVDTVVFDLCCVWGSAMFVRGVGWILCATQTGKIGLYATVAVAGLVAMLFYFVAF